MTDYSVRITVRNARILRRMKALGIPSIKQLAQLSGLAYTTVLDMVYLRKAPLSTISGDWLDSAYALSAALQAEPEELWTDAQRVMALKTSTAEADMNEEQVAQITSASQPERLIGQRQAIAKALSTIKPTDRECIERFFLNNEDPAELAEEMGVTQDCIRHRVKRGLWYLRNPKRRCYIEDYRHPDAED